MSSSFERAIQRRLENTYGLDFDVQAKQQAGKLFIEAYPALTRLESFVVKGVLSESTSFSIEIIPSDYGADYAATLASASIEGRMEFQNVRRLLSDLGATVIAKVNGQDIEDPSDESWPEQWKSYHFKIRVAPVFTGNEDERAQQQILVNWLSASVGLVLSLTDLEPIEEDDPQGEGMPEGKASSIISKKYERSRINRLLCIATKGTRCSICGFDFKENYGDLGDGFIHVHHLTPVSKMGEGYIVDPKVDLIPICPNCHAMLHRQDPPLTPEELKTTIKALSTKPIFP